MTGIILAGGQGTRLREEVPRLPKPMAPVGGRPFLDYLVAQLARAGVREVILATGHLAQAVEDHFGDGSRFGVIIRYSREGSPLGTGGALREAARLARGEEILLMNGDSFVDLDFPVLFSFHTAHRGQATMVLVHREDAGRYGLVETGKDGRILAFREKGAVGPGLINAGVCLLRPSALKGIPPGTVSFEREVLPRLVKRGIFGFPVHSFFIDIGVPGDYRAICREPERLGGGPG